MVAGGGGGVGGDEEGVGFMFPFAMFDGTHQAIPGMQSCFRSVSGSVDGSDSVCVLVYVLA